MASVSAAFGPDGPIYLGNPGSTAATHDNGPICTIDCDNIAGPFYFVMLANYMILNRLITVPHDFVEGAQGYVLSGLSPRILVLLLQSSAIVFAASVAWRNITVFHAVNQRMTVVSLLLASAALLPFDGIYSVVNSGVTSRNLGEWIAGEWIASSGLVNSFGVLNSPFELLLIFAAISIALLRRRKVKTLEIRLVDLLKTIEPAAPGTILRGLSIERRRRGFILLSTACSIIIAPTIAPHLFLPDLEIYFQHPRPVFHPGPILLYLSVGFFIPIVSFAMLLIARMQFQPTGESLLEEDDRSPVLFLRSFKDDQKPLKSFFSIRPISRPREPDPLRDFFLDPSLETRLASHFSNTGPFVAIGKRGRSAIFGAARLSINDDSEWQDRVVELMDSARLIVLVAGTTHWLQWELRTIADRGHFAKLILLFPEKRESRRMRTARLGAIVDAFIGTSWESSLRAISLPERVRGLVLQKDGLVTVMQAQSCSRNSYHLAAIIAHYLLADERFRTSKMKP